jgi:hypothetical protein
MKKLIFFFALLINIAFLSYAEENEIYPNDIVGRIWGNNPKPDLTKLDYNYEDDLSEIRINFIDGIEIILHARADYFEKQMVEIKKSGQHLFSFMSEYAVNPRYIMNAVYQIRLRRDNLHTILLEAYPEGATGRAASMTFGILIDVDNKNWQFLSTKGSVADCFVDVDNDGSFEFVSVQQKGSRGGRYERLLANVFSQDSNGLFTINNSMTENRIFILFFTDKRIEEASLTDPYTVFLLTPDIFNGDNVVYSPKHSIDIEFQ